nr:CFEM domain-containing protein [Colletotrichum truncatum]KAF6785859.1 CFEM domain-containing protein [Colletotrichum truncatum]
MEFASLVARRPEHVDVLTIPTPPHQATAIFITFFFPALSVIFFAGRAYSRLSTRQWGLDDWLCGLAVLCSLLMTPPFFIYLKLMYVGYWAVDVPPTFDPKPAMWWFFLMQMFYNPVLAFVRASVLVFLLRLGGQKPGVRWAIHGLNIINGSMAVAVFLVALLQCLPIEANWDPVVRQSARCVHNSFHISISSLNVVMDILVLAFPFWIFLGLKMRTGLKVAVICVFLIGAIVTVIAIIRLVLVYKLFYVPPDPNKDPFHAIGVVYNVVEVNLAIISAAAPALRPLFRKWWPKIFGGDSTKKTSDLHYYGSSSRPRNTKRDGDDITLKDMRMTRSQHHTEIRSTSPTGSEEEIMTYNGIVRTTNVNLTYESSASVADDGRSSTDFKTGEKAESAKGPIT